VDQGFLQYFIDGERAMFTLRLQALSHSETGASEIETLGQRVWWNPLRPLTVTETLPRKFLKIVGDRDVVSARG
jgi:hypothetical protein